MGFSIGYFIEKLTDLFPLDELYIFLPRIILVFTDQTPTLVSILQGLAQLKQFDNNPPLLDVANRLSKLAEVHNHSNDKKKPSNCMMAVLLQPWIHALPANKQGKKNEPISLV